MHALIAEQKRPSPGFQLYKSQLKVRAPTTGGEMVLRQIIWIIPGK